MPPKGSIKTPGSFLPLVPLDQDSENVPVCKAELLDRAQPREALGPRAWHSAQPTSLPGPVPWSECHAVTEVQTPRLARSPALKRMGRRPTSHSTGVCTCPQRQRVHPHKFPATRRQGRVKRLTDRTQDRRWMGPRNCQLHPGRGAVCPAPAHGGPSEHQLSK